MGSPPYNVQIRHYRVGKSKIFCHIWSYWYWNPTFTSWICPTTSLYGLSPIFVGSWVPIAWWRHHYMTSERQGDVTEDFWLVYSILWSRKPYARHQDWRDRIKNSRDMAIKAQMGLDVTIINMTSKRQDDVIGDIWWFHSIQWPRKHIKWYITYIYHRW